MRSLKVENDALFSKLVKDLFPEDSLLALRVCSEDKVGARIYRSFCNKNQVVGMSEDYC